MVFHGILIEQDHFRGKSRPFVGNFPRGGIVLSIRTISTFDDPILRQPCQEVMVIIRRIRRYIRDMVQTLRHTPNCCGLAGNQLGIPWRIVVIDVGDGPITLLNPRILRTEGEQIVEEGCMSFPGVWGYKRRPATVFVQAVSPHGKDVVLRGTGLLAQCLCHELEHLDGIVFCDQFLPEEEVPQP